MEENTKFFKRSHTKKVNFGLRLLKKCKLLSKDCRKNTNSMKESRKNANFCQSIMGKNINFYKKKKKFLQKNTNYCPTCSNDGGKNGNFIEESLEFFFFCQRIMKKRTLSERIGKNINFVKLYRGEKKCKFYFRIVIKG